MKDRNARKFSQGGKRSKIILDKSFQSKFFTKFEHHYQIGRGLHTLVFRGIMNGKAYVVKRIPVEFRTTQEAEHYVREMRALANLKHKNIVRYINAWIEQPPEGWQASLIGIKDTRRLTNAIQQYLLYSDHVAFFNIQMKSYSESISEYLIKEETRNLQRAKLWFEQIVSGITYLHKMNIIHQKLTPSNIIRDVGYPNVIKISDFDSFPSNGIRGNTEFDWYEKRMQSPVYAAPEQSVLVAATMKSNIYNMGLILTELCVRMSLQQTEKVFSDFRSGLPNAILDDVPGAAEIVARLTNLNSVERPTCNEILKYEFLKKPDIETYTDVDYKPDIDPETEFFDEIRRNLQNI